MSGTSARTHSDERRMLADAVAGFARQTDGVARTRALKHDPDTNHDAAIWARMADLGWLGVIVPEACGGLSLGVGELAVIAEGLGGAGAPEPFIEVAFAQAVLGACDDRCCRDLLVATATGESTVAVAWQSADAGLAIESITDGPRDGRLTTTRRLVQPAAADVFLVAVREAGQLAVYRVPRAAPGLSVQDQTRVDGNRFATLVFDNVALHSDACLARGEAAEAALAHGLCTARVTASAQLLGLADRLFTLTTDYLASRKQFDAPLSSFQVLRHRAVDLFIQRELMRNALRHAVRAFDRDASLAELQRAAARVKARCSQGALTIGREAVQLHGAIGYTEDADVGVYLRRVLALAAWLGNAAAQRHAYARLRGATAPESP